MNTELAARCYSLSDRKQMLKEIRMKVSIRYFVIKLLLLSSLAFFPMVNSSLAYAHTGIDTQNGWVHGFIHPVGGLDHVLAMIAVGLWATQIGGACRMASTFYFCCCHDIGWISRDNRGSFWIY